MTHASFSLDIVAFVTNITTHVKGAITLKSVTFWTCKTVCFRCRRGK